MDSSSIVAHINGHSSCTSHREGTLRLVPNRISILGTCRRQSMITEPRGFSNRRVLGSNPVFPLFFFCPKKETRFFFSQSQKNLAFQKPGLKRKEVDFDHNLLLFFSER